LHGAPLQRLDSRGKDLQQGRAERVPNHLPASLLATQGRLDDATWFLRRDLSTEDAGYCIVPQTSTILLDYITNEGICEGFHRRERIKRRNNYLQRGWISEVGVVGVVD
jgi:hypothetical protein